MSSKTKQIIAILLPDSLDQKKLKSKLLNIAIFFFISIICFILGRLSHDYEIFKFIKEDPLPEVIELDSSKNTSNHTEISENLEKSTIQQENNIITQENSTSESKESSSTSSIPREETTPSANNLTPQFVASKNGSKYHTLESGTAKRIKEENKIYFNSEAEAKQAGYEAGSSVK